MVYSYYPGCTLKNKAQDLDRYARLSAQALGITLEEIENWQCCGGVYPMAKDEIATKLSSVRALADAKAHGRDLITLCSACHNVLKQVNNDMLTDECQIPVTRLLLNLCIYLLDCIFDFSHCQNLQVISPLFQKEYLILYALYLQSHAQFYISGHFSLLKCCTSWSVVQPPTKQIPKQIRSFRLSTFPDSDIHSIPFFSLFFNPFRFVIK